MDTKIGLQWLTVSAVIPATAMILKGHTWLAAGTVGAVLVAAVVIVRIGERSTSERDKEILAYASTAASFGADPAPVIKALRANGEQLDDPDVVVEEARGPRLHVPRGRW
jgi:hypothetical protein